MRSRAWGLVVAAGAAAGCDGQKAGGPPDPGPPVVTVAAPVVRPVTQYTDLTGTLAAVESVDVRPQVGGYIQKVHFRDGQDVAAGQVLIEIDPSLYEADLKRAQAERQTAEAQLQQATATAGRLQRVRAGGAVSQEEVDVAEAQRKVAAAAVASAAAAVDRAQRNLGWTKVAAPINGRVDRVYVTPGNLVTGGTAQATVLTTVVSVDPVYAYFDVDEGTVRAYQRLVGEGKRKSVRQEAVEAEVQLRGEQGYPHKGALDFVSNRLNPATGTLQIRGTFPNPGPVRALIPGFFVRGRIPLATVAEAVLIPDSAVTTDQDRRVVYVVGPDNRVAVKPVALGPLSDGLRVVEQGLTRDDRVVVRGLQRVQPGMAVEPQPAPAGADPKSQPPTPNQPPAPNDQNPAKAGGPGGP